MTTSLAFLYAAMRSSCLPSFEPAFTASKTFLSLKPHCLSYPANQVPMKLKPSLKSPVQPSMCRSQEPASVASR
ncbi:hypothetical protein SHIRM173S_03806 [Streptomyces hirsutus]